MFKNAADFQKTVSRLKIDDKPNQVHEENLRREMLSAFEQTDRSPATNVAGLKTIRIKIMKAMNLRLAAAALIMIAALVGAHQFFKLDETSVVGEMEYIGIFEMGPEAPAMAPLQIELPKPMFVGTPQDMKVPNLEKPLGHPRRPFLAPVGTTNVALGKPVSSSDQEPIIGEIEMITDGDKEAADGSYVELGPMLQHVTIDLEAEHRIYAVVVWHYHKQARVYFDTIVQVADDPDFITDVRTVFNNDIDNSAGFGIGKDKHYSETNEGKLIDAKGVTGRHVRLYSAGNTSNDLNHYIEVEIYGIPVK